MASNGEIEKTQEERKKMEKQLASLSDFIFADDNDAAGDLGFRKSQRIIDREDDYRRRRLYQILSPDRHDAFSAGEKTPDPSVSTYSDIMRDEVLKREKEETLRAISKKKKEEEESGGGGGGKVAPEKEKISAEEEE